MKAEFDNHKCTILLYPERKDVWRKNAQPIKEVVENLAEIITQYELLILGYSGNNTPKLISKDLLKICNIEYDDIWIRDTGGVPVDNDNLAVFDFDAWSGLYNNVEKDITVAKSVAELCGLNIRKNNLVSEGGNLVSDGNGTLLAIKESFQKRNSIPLTDIENELKNLLNIKQIIWLNQGLVYDETGGHIDNLCVFADKNKILLSWTDDTNNPQYPIVTQAYNVLNQAKDINGNPYKIIKIPTPDIFYRTEDDCIGIELRNNSKNRMVGEPIQASYINFAFVNGAVIVPQFGLKQDEVALNIFNEVFKSRTVLPFSAREIVLGGGGIHCISRNI